MAGQPEGETGKGFVRGSSRILGFPAWSAGRAVSEGPVPCRVIYLDTACPMSNKPAGGWKKAVPGKGHGAWRRNGGCLLLAGGAPGDLGGLTPTPFNGEG